MAKPPVGAPWAPAPYEIRNVGDVQALLRGEATPEQQQRFMKWLVEDACATYDQSYRPESERDTVFAEGKRHVGLTIVKLSKLNTRNLRSDNVRSSSRDPERGPEPDAAGGRGSEPAERPVAKPTVKRGRPKRKRSGSGDK